MEVSNISFADGHFMSNFTAQRSRRLYLIFYSVCRVNVQK